MASGNGGGVRDDMTEETKKTLRLDEKLKAEDKLYDEMFHSRDAGILWKALVIAIVLHVAVLVINFPSFKRAIQPQKKENVIIVKKYIPHG